MKRRFVQNNLTHPLPDDEGADDASGPDKQAAGPHPFSSFTMSKNDLDSI